MRKKRIVWVAHEANKSGANLCLKEFMQIAANDAFEQILILPHSGNMETVANELNVQVKIVHYYNWITDCNSTKPAWLYPRKVLRNAFAIMQIAYILLKYRANLVFTNTSVISVGAWASLLTCKKHYWYIHEMGEEDFGFKLAWGKFGYWFMNFTSQKVLTNSNHLADKYRQKRNGFKIEVVRYAVNIDYTISTVALENNKPVKLLLLGQIAETKGHLLALKAIAALLNNEYSVSLSIVGRCENKNFLEKLNRTIAELGIGEKVTFVDYSNNPANIIAEHHALLMCSKCEAFGRVTVEAMKVGIPVIGSNTCGTKELIEHKKTGYLFTQGDALSLAKAIEEMMDDNVLRQQIISQAKVSAEEFTNKKHFLTLLNNL